MKINTDVLEDVEHTKLCIPYLRVVRIEDQVTTFDMRMSQPNISFITSDVLHSIEHMLNVELRKRVNDKFVVAAPLGCSTGFWLVAKNISPEEFSSLLYESIKYIVDKYIEVPLCSVHTCGNYRNHNLAGAKEALQFYIDNYEKWATVYI